MLPLKIRKLLRSTNNRIIRQTMTRYGLRQWEAADMIGVHPDTLSKWLRHELPEAEQIRIAEMIEGKVNE